MNVHTQEVGSICKHASAQRDCTHIKTHKDSSQVELDRVNLETKRLIILLFFSRLSLS